MWSAECGMWNEGRFCADYSGRCIPFHTPHSPFRILPANVDSPAGAGRIGSCQSLWPQRNATLSVGSLIRSSYLLYFSQPASDRAVYKAVSGRKVRGIVEIG